MGIATQAKLERELEEAKQKQTTNLDPMLTFALIFALVCIGVAALVKAFKKT